MSMLEPNCSRRKCKHFLGVKDDDRPNSEDVVICTAFPDGIPDAIAYGPIPHTRPYQGDHGIQYEKGPMPV